VIGQLAGRSWLGPWGNGQRFLQNVHIDSGGHSASYSVGAGGSFPGGKSGRCVRLMTFHPSIAEVLKEWSCTFAALYTFIQCIGVTVTFLYANFKERNVKQCITRSVEFYCSLIMSNFVWFNQGGWDWRCIQTAWLILQVSINCFVVKLEDVTSDTWEGNIGRVRNGMVRLWIRFACIGWG
jgi:hypothetical protein